MLDKALDNARAGRDAALDDLIEELRIPSISTLRDHRGECRRNAEWLSERLTGLGFETKIVDVVDDGNPVIHSEWMGRPGAPLLTIYGHYDVQPDDPLDEWDSKPFEPVVKDGFVIARGCADNKGNHMAALKAAEAWMAAGGPPVNLRFLIEGEEEIGGDALPNYLYESSDALQSDYVLLWDGGFTTDDRPSLVVGMRGSVHIEIEVSGPSRDIHSGSFGGVAPNPCNELARIIHLLKDDEGRITVPGYYDDVAEPDPDEKSKWHRPQEDILIKATGAKRLTGEDNFEPAERLWARPTLDVTGIIGGFTGEGQKTIIPATCRAKVSARLVPNQDPDKVLDSLEAHIHDLASDAVTVKVERMSKCSPVVLGYDHKGVEAAANAFEASFGQPPVFVRTGGSIPVATAFNEALNAAIVTSGISQADSRAHSPNENLRIENYHKGTEMLIRFMDNLVR